MGLYELFGGNPVDPAPMTEREEQQARYFLDHSFLSLFARFAIPILVLVGIAFVLCLRAARGDHGVVEKLDRDGTTTQAEVVDVSTWGRGGELPRARLAFTTESGRRVTTWAAVDEVYERGVRLQVRYSRSEPTVARVVGHDFPHRDDWRVPAAWGTLVLATIAAAVGLGKYHWRRQTGW